MGMSSKFNDQLNETNKRFTYFVPRDWAWQQTEKEFPSTHKKLFMREYAYHVSVAFSFFSFLKFLIEILCGNFSDMSIRVLISYGL